MKQILSILIEPLHWIYFLLSWTPGKIGVLLRRLYYKVVLASCGSALWVEQGCTFRGLRNIFLGSDVGCGESNRLYACGSASRLVIGDRSRFNANVMLNADINGQITIGKDVLIGPNVVMRASDHSYRSREKKIREQGHQAGKIVIEDDVWIGANVVIVSNVTVGQGAVVAAGAVVTKDVEPYCVVAGVPAKPIGKRT